MPTIAFIAFLAAPHDGLARRSQRVTCRWLHGLLIGALLSISPPARSQAAEMARPTSSSATPMAAGSEQPGASPRAPALLLANVLHPDIDVSLYLVSEKFDGVRAIWDGRQLRFRSGRPVPAPAWWQARLPREPLDGELWLARGRFDRLSGIVRRSPPDDDEWQQVNYLIFELPGASGSFAERYTRIRQIVTDAGWPPLVAVEQTPAGNRTELNRRLDAVLRAGGEGLMLHRADAPYQTGRSDVLLKLKPQLDAEATVIGHLPGKGRLAGSLGALRVRTPEGIVFNLGSGLTAELRRQPPAVGTVVTYRYRELTPSGTPRFASFLRVRDDP